MEMTWCFSRDCLWNSLAPGIATDKRAMDTVLGTVQLRVSGSALRVHTHGKPRVWPLANSTKVFEIRLCKYT